MKKKLLIPIIIGVVVVLIALIIAFILWNNRVVTKVSIDINPSIELGLSRNGIVKEIKGYNEDGKKVISKDLTNKKFEDVINTLSNRIMEEYLDGGEVYIILHTEGKMDIKEIEKTVMHPFEDKHLHVEVIVIDKITKEDEKLAKKYGISPSKAAYINALRKELPEVPIESLINKPVDDLKRTKDSGLYCDDGYILDGDFCLIEVKREKAPTGKVCPEGYLEYNGKCYEEKPFEETDKLVCPEDRTLENKKCIKTITEDAKPSKYHCTTGEEKTKAAVGLTGSDAGDANDIVCVDYSSATHPVSPCEATDGTEYTVVGGVCYWHRAPVIESGCPGKIQVAGECWDNATGIYICPGKNDGMTYKSRDEYCIGSIKYANPVVTEYKCNEGFTLEGTKCTRKEEEDARNERVCPTGFKMIEFDRCIGTKEANKIDGLVCTAENSKLKGDYCVFYDAVEAKHN